MKKYIPLISAALLLLTGCISESAKKVEILDEYAGAKTKVTLPADPIPADGGTLTVTVASEVPFTVSIPAAASWLTASATADQITFSAAANTSTEKRWASITLVDPQTQFAITSFDVTQAGTVTDVILKKFYVSTETLSARADQTESIFTVTAEVPWTAVSDHADFTLSPASGDGSATITVTYPANTVPEEKVAHITVATSSTEVNTASYTITLTQAAGKETGQAVKPAVGTVLAEWEFDTPQVDALRLGGYEQNPDVASEDAPGNVGGIYVPSNVSGNGRLEYYNGTDKSSVTTKKHKRRIGERGEPCYYCCWEGDYFVWTAVADAPLAAGTKFQINFVLRPNNAGVMKYWKCEFLDGEVWKELDTIELEFHSNAAGTAEDPKQVNTFIRQTATLTADTPYAQFRFTATRNAQCGDGSPASGLSSSHVLRFAGKWSDASDANKYLQVPENPKIVVVE